MAETTHKLLAIMFTDIEGYSTLMGQNEEKALGILEKNREIHKTQIEHFNGSLLKDMGDGTMVSFGTATEAVKCAIEIQKLSIENKIPLRVGIHLGEVTVSKNDIWGDGVNIASRIEQLGVAGSVLLSRTVKDEIENKGVKTKGLGDVNLKNIRRSISVYAVNHETLSVPDDLQKSKPPRLRMRVLAGTFLILITITGVIWFSSPNNPSKETDKLISIAVTPFDFRGQEAFSYAGDAVMDLISTGLSGFEGIAPLDPSIINAIYEKEKNNLQTFKNSKFFEDYDLEYIVDGFIVQGNESLQLVCNLTTFSGSHVTTINHSVRSIDSLFLEVDLIIIELLGSILEIDQKEVMVSNMKTSKNINSVREFLKGEQEHRLGEYEKADEHYRSALTADSTFASAWVRWWYNSTRINASDVEQEFAKQKATELKNDLPPYMRAYLDGFNLLSNGQPYEALKRLQEFRNIYGEYFDIIYLIGEIKFHLASLLDQSPLSATIEFEKLYELGDQNISTLANLLKIFAFEGNGDGWNNLYSSLPETYPDYSLYKSLNSFFDYGSEDHLPVSSGDLAEFSTYDILQTFFLLGKADKFQTYYSDNYENFKKGSSNFESLIGFNVLSFQGRFKEAAESFPSIFTEGWFDLARFSSEANFQPLGKDEIGPILHFLDSSIGSYSDKSLWHLGARAMLERISGNLDNWENSIIKLRKRQKEYLIKYTNDSISEHTYQFYHRWLNYQIWMLKLTDARLNKDLETATLYVDSLLNNYVYYPNYKSYETFYVQIKFTQFEILFEQGNYTEARELGNRLLQISQIRLISLWLHAPIHFRMATIYDELSNMEKSLYHYKYFYSLYKDCDPFYQDNVAFAKQRIEELEAMQIEAN